MTFKATFDGKVLIPERPLGLFPGTVVQLEVLLPASTEPPCTSGVPAETSLLQRLARIAEDFPDDPDDPVDGAAEHDHYLYGTPKTKEAS